MRVRASTLVGLVLAAVLGLGVLGSAAVAAPGARAASAAAAGYDVSYPQCRSVLPTGAGFAVVGVDGGRAFLPNPCLGGGSAGELAWALRTGAAQFYANTGDPGPAYSSNWSIARWANRPARCRRASRDSLGCSYDYGWYAAADSFAHAVAAERALGRPGKATARATWWLDVETANSWESLERRYAGHPRAARARDVAALRGELAYLAKAGVRHVGIYSTRADWAAITGGVSFRRIAEWVPGFSGAAQAAQGCAAASAFAGGRVAMTQYASGPFDADRRC
jgi:hypothetical protein